MLTILFYEAEHEAPTQQDAIEEALLAEAGLALDGVSGDAYRPGNWCQPATRAVATIDCGVPPLEEDHIHPPKSYPGWRPLALSLQVPLAGPHWCCVEATGLVERLAERLQAAVLDTEDGRSEEEAVPGPVDRMALLASWERQMQAHIHTRTDMLFMQPRASLALWRYRRERQAAEAAIADDDLLWPEALVLTRTGSDEALSAAFWMDPTLPLAMPPVQQLVLHRAATEIGVLPADELLVAAGSPEPEPHAGATAIQPDPATRRLFAEAILDPVQAYRSVDLLEWTDQRPVPGATAVEP